MVSRAGASIVAELAVAGRPALLVPFSHATDDHQTANARALVDAGGAWMIDEKEFNVVKLEFLNTSELKSAITNLEIKENNSKSPSLEKIKDVEDGLLDRFGPLPLESTFLLEVSKIRVLLTNTSVKKLVLRKNNLVFTVSSFRPFSSAVAFLGAILTLFNVTDEDLSLKNNKDKSVSVSVEGAPVGYSSIKKISNQLETLFLK